jgi:hypothetical protein
MTTTPDFRALCAELLAAFEIQLEEMSFDNRLCKRACAALATPPPEPPTYEELQALWHELFSHDDTVSSGDVEVIARAVLERWGNAQPT